MQECFELYWKRKGKDPIKISSKFTFNAHNEKLYDIALNSNDSSKKRGKPTTKF